MPRRALIIFFVLGCAALSALGAVTVEYAQSDPDGNTTSAVLPFKPGIVYEAVRYVIEDRSDAAVLERDDAGRRIAGVIDFQKVRFAVDRVDETSSRLTVTSDVGEGATPNIDQAVISMEAVCDRLGVICTLGN
ncbi:MAG: hypothetical protein ACYC5N_00625 [Endomicrobiales bacterium]